MSSYYQTPKNILYSDEQIFPIKSIKMPNNKRIYLSASATVEASIVIPLFIYAVMTITFLLQIIGIQLQVKQALYNETRKIAKYMYIYNEVDNKNDEKKITTDEIQRDDSDDIYKSIIKNGINSGILELLFRKEVGDEFIGKSYIVGGNFGFHMNLSTIKDKSNKINIVVTYTIKNPFDIFGYSLNTITQNASTYAWVGNESFDKDEETKNSDNDKLVYITPSGEVYHTNKNCTYLVFSIHEISNYDLENQRNLSGGKYYACEKCGNFDTNGKYYITDFGDRYHTTKSCSSIMRNIITVKLSQVADKQQCSKCKGE